MSVMNGFHHELVGRILGINSHTQGKVACVISYTDGGTLLVGSRKLERPFIRSCDTNLGSRQVINSYLLFP